MRVLLTGASGFVGSALCDELTKQGHEVFALMRKSSSALNLRAARFTPVTGDLREPVSLQTAVRDAEIILHVAGVVAARSRDEYFLHNAAGTRNLVKAAEAGAQHLKRFVYISSLAAAGPSTLERSRVEEDANAPVSFYGESKLAGEEVVRASSLPSVIVRPPAVYGPRDRGILTFFDLINKGVRLSIGGAKERRYSFVHVDDLVQGILAAALYRGELARGETFYVSGDGDASWDQAMTAMGTALGKKSLSVKVPVPVLTALGALYSGLGKATGKAFPLTLDKVKELTAPAWTCSNAKAKRVLKYEPYWSLDRGLEQTVRWYRDQGWLK